MKIFENIIKPVVPIIVCSLFITLCIYTIIISVRYSDIKNEFNQYKNIKDSYDKKEDQEKIGRFFLDETNNKTEWQLTIMSLTGETRYLTVVTKKDLECVKEKINKVLK